MNKKPHPLELGVVDVMTHSPHCFNCGAEIIKDAHVLVPGEDIETHFECYVPYCQDCAYEYIQGGYDDEDEEEED